MTYDDLLELIKKEAPYPTPIDFDLAPASIVRDGFAKDNNEQNPSLRETETLSDDENQDAVWIHIDGKWHRCPKAIMIPVTFVRNNRSIHANWIVGFGGPGV